MNQYYNQWSDENYSESEWMDIIPEPSRDRDRICNNLAQFTKFDHLECYDNIKKLYHPPQQRGKMTNEGSYHPPQQRGKMTNEGSYQYLAKLESTSKGMPQAVADFRKTISAPNLNLPSQT